MTNSAPPARPILHCASDAEAVADALAAHLAQAPRDVFDELVVTCEGPGTQRWLAHRLTRELGISAGIAMPPFRSWSERVVARAAGIDPDTDPWRHQHMSWPVLQQIDRAQEWAGTALDHVAAAGGSWWLARHAAGILLDYARRDPALLGRWSRGHDDDVAPELAWQPRLWRRLLVAPTLAAVPDPVTRLALAEQALLRAPAPEVPAEVHVWAPGALDGTDVRLLVALAARHAVHLWLPGQVLGAGHPLLAVLDLERATTLAALSAAGAEQVTVAGPPAPPARTALDRLRADLARGVASPAVPLDPADTSISLHSCHGPDRQAEVLRDVLCGLLEDDPTIEPRDVLVAVADPSLLPVLEAAFAQVELPGSGGHPARTLPVRFADPELRDHNELLGCLVTALCLGRGRAGVTDLVSLLSAGPVARRFGLDEEGVRRAHDLVTAAGVRWGMNAAHRSRFGLDGVTANTWLAGLNRMLVGIAMTEDGSHAVRSAVPLDDVGSSDIEVVGAVAELMVRLIRLSRDAETTHSAREWAAICREAIGLLAEPAREDAWQLDHAWQVLAEIADAAPDDAPPIGLDDLLDLLADAARGRLPRSAFRSGAITVCSLWPARHVPYRVVCVVGLGDGLLPRPERVDGDNLLDLHPDADRLGTRHRDRQVFLDLVRAARQHLVLTWTGADARTGEHRPPAVVVSELLDVLDATVQLPDGGPARDALVAHHPLQPYAPACFGDRTQAPYRASALTGFDPAAAAAARALVEAPGRIRSTGADTPLAGRLRVPAWQWEGDVVPLTDVVDVLVHPARSFLRRRAGFTLWSADEAPADTIPLELDGLGTWAVGTRVLQATLRGDRLEEALRAEHLRGTLPPGATGNGVLDRVGTDVERILRESAALRAEAPVGRHVRVPLPGAGLVLLADVTLRGRGSVSVQYGRINARHRLAAWFELLALAAAGTVERPQAHLVGRKDHVCLTAPDASTALFLLERWVQVATVGLSHPLPLPLRTGALLASSVRPGTAGSDLSGHRGLRDAWENDLDDNWRRLWGHDLARLVGAPRPDEVPAIGDESSWMADLARGLWTPIDQAEERR